jgi:hypothetical protein
MKYRTNPGTFRYRNGSFKPKGKLHEVGEMRQNPAAWRSKDTLSARLFVGFNVDDKPTYSLDDLIELVGEYREHQKKAGASFLAQTGIYQHKNGPIVEEEGAQVIIIDVWDTPEDAFADEMIDLAETIAEDMQQEEVVVEIQKNGITTEVLGVIP